MGRYGRRISRSLIGALVVTVVLGVAFYLKDLAKTKAEEPRSVAQAPVPSQPPRAIVAAPRPAPAPAQNPSPATQPIGRTTTPTPTTTPAVPSVTIGPGTSNTSPTTTPPPPAPVGSLADGFKKKDAGDLLGARRILNAALLSGRLSAGEIDSAKRALAEINQTVVFSSKRFPDDELGGTHSVQSGEVLQKIAVKYDVTWEALARLNGLSDPRKLRAGQVLKVIHGPFNAVVYKSKFVMDVYLGGPGEKGSMYVTSFPVGLGKDDSTPTGTWLVEPGKKLKNPPYFSPRGEGIIDADDPKNPLGERWIPLTGIDGHAVGKASYGIHGTIDEASIGRMESMGCIRLKNADVEWLYDLLVDGKSTVIIKD